MHSKKVDTLFKNKIIFIKKNVKYEGKILTWQSANVCSGGRHWLGESDWVKECVLNALGNPPFFPPSPYIPPSFPPSFWALGPSRCISLIEALT